MHLDNSFISTTMCDNLARATEAQDGKKEDGGAMLVRRPDGSVYGVGLASADRLPVVVRILCWSARESQVRPAKRQRAPTKKKWRSHAGSNRPEALGTTSPTGIRVAMRRATMGLPWLVHNLRTQLVFFVHGGVRYGGFQG